MSLCATLMLSTFRVTILSLLDHCLSSVARIRLSLSTTRGHGSHVGLISLECAELLPAFYLISVPPVPCGDLLRTPAPCGDFPVTSCPLIQLSHVILLSPF